jgi:predicted ATPase
VLAELLARCPRLHLLVTSRRALGLDGELEMALPALPPRRPLPAASRWRRPRRWAASAVNRWRWRWTSWWRTRSCAAWPMASATS